MKTHNYILIIDSKDGEHNRKTFPGYQNIEELNGLAGKSSTIKCDWHNSKEAQAFRKFFKGSLKKGLKSHSQESHGEHTLESAFLTAIEKRDSITKSLCYIQPVKLKNLRFQFPTILSASKLHKDITNKNNIKHLSYSEKGGGIDILARRKKGNQSYLTVIELKDEYKSISSFTPIKLSCLLNDKKLEVTISTSNHIVVKLDDELVK